MIKGEGVSTCSQTKTKHGLFLSLSFRTNQTRWWLTWTDVISWDLMGSHMISRDLMGSHGISWDLMWSHRISSDLMGSHGMALKHWWFLSFNTWKIKSNQIRLIINSFWFGDFTGFTGWLNLAVTRGNRGCHQINQHWKSSDLSLSLASINFDKFINITFWLISSPICTFNLL